MVVGYGTNVDAALDALRAESAADFVRLALASLDQAGVSVRDLASVSEGCRDNTEDIVSAFNGDT